MMNPGKTRFTALALAALLLPACAAPAPPQTGRGDMWIIPGKDGTGFVHARSGKRFIAWGFNYDHDDAGRLLEDYWQGEWPVVVEDFEEMKELGANTVRIHLQFAKFVKAPGVLNEASLERLARLVKLAEEIGLHLDVTGLCCYRKEDVPPWYDAMDEAARWEQQALFWEGVAGTCARSPAVFCYDLMNEPILPGKKKKETEWLAGAFDGKYFVQRISLDLAGRSRLEVAAAWVDRLVAAIRKHDGRHMVTVGVIPWALTFPGAKPIFYSREAGKNLDFVSVHFYPKRGEIDKALAAIAVYDVGKPLVVEEMFPLKCGKDEMNDFIDASRTRVDGYISFYWGKTPGDYGREKTGIKDAIIKEWLESFRDKGREILAAKAGSTGPRPFSPRLPGR